MDTEFVTHYMDEHFPNLRANAEQCGHLVASYCESSDDVVHRWLMEQWNNGMHTIRLVPLPMVVQTALSNMGATALAMQRVGIPEFQVFQDTAADMMKGFSDCMAMDVADQSSETVPHDTTIQ